MRTDLPHAYQDTAEGARANEILRSCVHCGFCNATCPTYQLLGDELDGPRGRIYLIKDLLETQQVNDVAVRHLDRCLTCRACETTCPSGVAYGELLEIGRAFVEQAPSRDRGRGLVQRGLRRWLLRVVPQPERFRRWLAIGRRVRGLLPARLRRQVPPLGRAAATVRATAWAPHTAQPHGRVLLLEGCVQRASTPDVNDALRRLLDSRGIEVVRESAENCCGSLALHLGAAEQAHRSMGANVDALSQHLDEVDAVLSTASGCGVTVKDYGRLLARDPVRAQSAERLAGATRDAAEYLSGLSTEWRRDPRFRRVAWHAPCTLQHGQRITGVVEGLLRGAGYELVPVRDPHLCCGSAGTYSVLQPELAERLKADKLAALHAHGPDVIATANVGCQLHLVGDAGVPVMHWLQLLR